MLRKSPLLNTIVILLIIYMLFVGATFNGLLHPQIKLFSMILVGGMIVYWLFYRRQQRWQWYRTSIDITFLLWAIAFSVSLLANIDDWRRIALGMWYVGLYIGIWLTLSDMLMNKAVARGTVVTAILYAGALVLYIGYVQISTWVGQWVSLLMSGVLMLEVPRPTSTLMNTNILGGFLVMLVPLILSRLISARVWFTRVILIIFLLSDLLMIIITASRGAWLGLLVSLPVWLVLILMHYNLFSWSRLYTWWQSQGNIKRLITGSVVLAAIAIVTVTSVLFMRLFVMRGLNGRDLIYSAAWVAFTEKPLTGFGLFTFGHLLAREVSFPPELPHSHAHNGILQIAAELGIPGLLALMLTTWAVIRAIRHRWKVETERLTLVGVVASIVGVITHHMTDFTGIMPAIALAFLCVLCIACTSLDEAPLQGIAQRVRLPLIASLWAGLLISGLWSAKVYIDFFSIFERVVETRDFRSAAEELNTIIAADPLPGYTLQQAFLYGMAANEGDINAARLGAAAYNNYLAIQPNYAFGWINLAALRWQLGEPDAAISAAQQAVALAPRAAPYWMLLGRYLESNGRIDEARNAYSQAITNDSDIRLLPEWSVTPLQQELAAYEPSVLHQTFLLLRSRQAQEALITWQSNPNPYSYSLDAVIRALAAGAQDDYVSATTWLDRARFLVASPSDSVWLHLGTAWIADWRGDNEGFTAEVTAACNLLVQDPLAAGSYWQGSEILYLQYLRSGIPRVILPQTDFPRYNPLAWYLLNC